MKYLYFLSFLFVFLNASHAQDANEPSPAQPDSPFLSSDFFSGALADAQEADAEDAMGTQRLVQVKSSDLTPAVALSTAFKYTSNPEKAAEPTKKDGTTADLSLTFTMGLGEYGIGEEVICTPSFMFMQMRTFTDPVRDHGEEMQLYDVDVLVAGLSFPFILPNDYSLTIGHTYAAPYQFRGPKNLISYSNTPAITFNKTFPLAWGDILSLTTGVSYAFSSGDTPESSLDPALYQFLLAATNGQLLTDSPVNLQDGLTHNLNLSYIMPVGEKLSLTPSFTYSNMLYAEGSNTSRSDKTYNAGINASYPVTDWFNFSAATNYMWKTSNDDTVPEFDDFIGGITLGVNYAF